MCRNLLAKLPRLQALSRRPRLNCSRDFFLGFSCRLDGAKATFDHYAEIEDCLTFVPCNSWNAFAEKVDKAACQLDHKHHRNWERLHDVFNEGRGARLLKKRYDCTWIEMLPAQADRKTPDWRGMSVSKKLHYAEVKTINHSNEDQSMWAGGPEQPSTSGLSVAFHAKLEKTYREACQQLAAAEDADFAVKVVVLVIHVDHNIHSLDRSRREMIDGAVSGLACEQFPLHPEIVEG
jgi:hypothetical protein